MRLSCRCRSREDPSVAVCLGPDLHKDRPRCQMDAVPTPILLLSQLRPRLFSLLFFFSPSLQKKSALAERKPQLNFMVPLLFAKLILQFKGTKKKSAWEMALFFFFFSGALFFAPRSLYYATFFVCVCVCVRRGEFALADTAAALIFPLLSGKS